MIEMIIHTCSVDATLSLFAVKHILWNCAYTGQLPYTVWAGIVYILYTKYFM